MKIILLIGLGGFIGAISRYLLSIWIHTRFSYPFYLGTFAVNIIGCFLIGLVYAMAEKQSIGVEWRLFLATGLLGGFTTFSSFSYETITMIQQTKYLTALFYAGGSLVLGFTATIAGIFFVKLF